MNSLSHVLRGCDDIKPWSLPFLNLLLTCFESKVESRDHDLYWLLLELDQLEKILLELDQMLSLLSDYFTFLSISLSIEFTQCN